MDTSEPVDLLFELERKIAQRADELSRQRTGETHYSLANWLDAEREICRDYIVHCGLNIPSTADVSGR